MSQATHTNALLSLTGVHTHIGAYHILHGVDLAVPRGQLTMLLGRNGAGKTTTLRTVMGLLTRSSGSILFDGLPLHGEGAHVRYHRGLAYVPEDRRIVPGLTVRENLQLGLIASTRRGETDAMIDEIAATFPRLKERLAQEATSMSGGEQQMLAIARAMMARPKMILLDEPSEGIMPLLVHEMFELFVRMKEQGTTILLVEQNVETALRVSDRAYILDHGQVVHQGSASELLSDAEIQSKYCAV